MNLSGHPSFRQTGPPCQRLLRILWLLLAPIISVSGVNAQETADKVLVDKGTLQTLLQRVDELEARVKQLEAGGPPDATSRNTVGATGMVPASKTPTSGTASRIPSSVLSSPSMTSSSIAVKGELQPKTGEGMTPAAGASASPPQDQEPSQSENMMAERMDLSKTLLRIRGFGDVNFGGNTEHGNTTSFALGQLDLFTTSDISERFKFISEIVFEGATSNIYGQPKQL